MSEYSVSVFYDGHSLEKDDEINVIAQNCGGYEAGSGFMISTGERDVQCAFTNESDAGRFQQKIEKLDWLTSIGEIECY